VQVIVNIGIGIGVAIIIIALMLLVLVVGLLIGDSDWYHRLTKALTSNTRLNKVLDKTFNVVAWLLFVFVIVLMFWAIGASFTGELQHVIQN